MKKKMKKKIIVGILCLVFGVGAYFGSLFLDRARKGGRVDVTVTFDDTESYVIQSINKLTKEEAIKEWPYIMNVENKGNAKGLYQMKISDMKDNTLTKDDLEYLLLLNDKEVASGKLKNIQNDVLYTGEINGKEKQNYKLYIWVYNDIEENKDYKYEYKIEFNTIKAGGPGF